MTGQPSTSVLVVNAGSTSLKLHLVDRAGKSRPVETLEAAKPYTPAAVVHRIVHGGALLREPVLIDARVHDHIEALEPLAPLHNAPALAGVARARALLPEIPHIAVFDTAFHRSMPDEAAAYPLPRRWREEWGVERYGFHGLSVAWSAERVPELLGQSPLDLTIVVCHLGGGSSVTAVRNGRSLDTTMGFSPLEGVPMGTRAGSVDPGAIIYLLRERGLSVDELEWALNHDSGLKGLAGGSGGMRETEQAAAGGDPRAELAIDVYTHRVAGAVAAMAASACRIDALVFTAGIGEHSARVREAVCSRLGFLGVELDLDRNRDFEPDSEVGTPGAKVRVLVVQAREEVIAGREGWKVVDELCASSRPSR